MGALVVVSTCPRIPAYLDETLASLEAAGAEDHERWILTDGMPCEATRTGWTSAAWVGARPAFRSSRNNLWGAFRLAVERKAERLLFFEDDIVACTNAVERMATVPIPEEAALITFHDVKEMDPGAPAGLHLTQDAHGKDGWGLWGMQALAVAPRVFGFLAGCDPFAVLRANLRNSGDRTLEHYISVSPWPRYAIHVPCLVQHVGAVSEARPGKTLEFRPTSNWRGVDFDAMGTE